MVWTVIHYCVCGSCIIINKSMCLAIDLVSFDKVVATEDIFNHALEHGRCHGSFIMSETNTLGFRGFSHLICNGHVNNFLHTIFHVVLQDAIACV